MGFLAKYEGKTVKAKGEYVNIRSEPNTQSKIVEKCYSPNIAGTSTGNFENQSDGSWYEIARKNGDMAWVRFDVFIISKESSPVPYKDGTGLIKKIVAQDFTMYHNLLFVSENIERLKNKGRNTSTYEKKLTGLINSYSKRQNEIKTSKLVKFQTGFNKLYTKLKRKFSDLLGINGEAIGIAPVVAVAIGAVVAVGASALIYFAFRPSYNQSKIDLEESESLKKLLDSTDPTTAQAIREDLKTQLEEAYKEGKKAGGQTSFSEIKNSIIIALIGLGIYKAVTWVQVEEAKKKKILHG